MSGETFLSPAVLLSCVPNNVQKTRLWCLFWVFDHFTTYYLALHKLKARTDESVYGLCFFVLGLGVEDILVLAKLRFEW